MHLHLEEAQSDSHQKGRKHGYYDQNPENYDITKVRDDVGGASFVELRNRYTGEEHEVLKSTSTANDIKYAIVRRDSKDITPSNRKIYVDEIIRYKEELVDELLMTGMTNAKKMGVSKVPDLPFKKSWPSLILKTHIQDALGQGIKKISWTSGSTQNTRNAKNYPIDKVVLLDGLQRLSDSHIVNKGFEDYRLKRLAITVGQGDYQILVSVDKDGQIVGAGRNGSDYVPQRLINGVRGKGLDEVIGKAMAKEVLETPHTFRNYEDLTDVQQTYSVSEVPVKEWSGDGFKFEDQAFINFYDKELVSLATKIGKKIGASKPYKIREAGDQSVTVDVTFRNEYADDTALGFDLQEKLKRDHQVTAKKKTGGGKNEAVHEITGKMTNIKKLAERYETAVDGIALAPFLAENLMDIEVNNAPLKRLLDEFESGDGIFAEGGRESWGMDLTGIDPDQASNALTLFMPSSDESATPTPIHRFPNIPKPKLQVQPKVVDFKEQFMQGSEVVDDAGNPIVFYHGTLDDFTVFRSGHKAMGHGGSSGDFGIHFGDAESANTRLQATEVAGRFEPQEIMRYDDEQAKRNTVIFNRYFKAKKSHEKLLAKFGVVKDGEPQNLTAEQMQRLDDSSKTVERLAKQMRQPDMPLGSRVTPVILNIKNALEIDDIGSFHDPVSVMTEVNSELVDRVEGWKSYPLDNFLGEVNIVKLLEESYTGNEINTLGIKELAFEKLQADLESLGIDGLKYSNDFESESGAMSYVAFRPEQVKSAIGNIGTYDPANPDIRYMPSSPEQRRANKIGKIYSDLDKSSREFADRARKDWKSMGFSAPLFQLFMRGDGVDPQFENFIATIKGNEIVPKELYHVGNVGSRSIIPDDITILNPLNMVKDAPTSENKLSWSPEDSMEVYTDRKDAFSNRESDVKPLTMASNANFIYDSKVDSQRQFVRDNFEEAFFAKDVDLSLYAKELQQMGWHGYVDNTFKSKSNGKRVVIFDPKKLKLIEDQSKESKFFSKDRAYGRVSGLFGTVLPVDQVFKTTGAGNDTDIRFMPQSKAFKSWLGDSKITNPDGSPKVVFHGTGAGTRMFGNDIPDFDVFDRQASGRKNFDNIGSWFTDNEGQASVFGTNVKPVYLSIKKPWVLDKKDLGKDPLAFLVEMVDEHGSGDEFHDFVKALDYDGIVIKNQKVDNFDKGDSDYYVALDPNQIKSATENSGEYNPANPSYRMMPWRGMRGDPNIKYFQDNIRTPNIPVDSIKTLSGQRVVVLEADRHDIRVNRMGGPLHPFLEMYAKTAVEVDGERFKGVWANMAWNFVSGAISKVNNSTKGQAVIAIMDDIAHRSNKASFNKALGKIEKSKKNMTTDQKRLIGHMIDIATTMKSAKESKRQTLTNEQKNIFKRLSPVKSALTRGDTEGHLKQMQEMVDEYKKFDWWSDPYIDQITSNFKRFGRDKTFNQRAQIMTGLMDLSLYPSIKQQLAGEMDFRGAKTDQAVAVVQLSKHKLNDPQNRVFAVYFGKDPEQIKRMSPKEMEARDKFLAQKDFKVHPSYEWLMLGPEDANNFVLDKQVDLDKLIPQYRKLHHAYKKRKSAEARKNFVGSLSRKGMMSDDFAKNYFLMKTAETTEKNVLKGKSRVVVGAMKLNGEVPVVIP
jgi:hypothetical protein